MIESFDHHTPTIAPTAWVHELASVIGHVELAGGVSIWPGAVLRGDMGPIYVGENTNLQDGAVCHNTGGLSVTKIGARVTVGHRAILHGCTVEDDCLIGMGAIVMDNAVVGTGSIIAAGAIVTMRQVVPPGSMVMGSPGRVVKAITDKQREWIEHAWTVYAEKTQKWLDHPPPKIGG